MKAKFPGHLNPNVLAAFAERTLNATERRDTARHLAECADCREHLFLAFGAVEPEGDGASIRTASPAFAWFSGWRLAASLGIAACVFLFVQSHQSHRPTRATGSQANQVSSPARSNGPLAAATAKMETKPDAGKVAKLVQRDNNLTSSDRSSRGQPAITPPTVPDGDPALDNSSRLAVARAETAVRHQSHTRPSAMLISSEAVHRRMFRQECQWRIAMPGAAPAEARGQIQRSFDGGRTWESVFLNDGKGFQAVASSGSHVWAGGSHGILFYSPDAGSHWARIGVADGNARLTDAIVNIEAQSPDRTKLTTRSGKEWLGFHGNWRELRDVERPGK